MDQWLAQLLMVIESVGLICATALIAYRMKLRHERSLLEDHATRLELEQRLEELRTLTQAQISELQERLDFSERILLQRGAPPIQAPEIPTPV